MLRLPSQVYLAAAALTWTCLACAGADPEQRGSFPTDWSAELGVGVEYDSNVSVDEVDVNSSQGDYAPHTGCRAWPEAGFI